MTLCVGRIACVIRWARREFDEAQPDLRSDTLGGRRRCRELVFTLAHSPHVAVRFAPTTPSCVGAPGLQISYSHVTIPSPQLAPPMCRYARMPVRFHARYAPNPTRTQYPHQQRPRSPPLGYRIVPNLRICSLLRSAKTLRSYDTISSTLLVTRPVQSSTLVVTHSQKTKDQSSISS